MRIAGWDRASTCSLSALALVLALLAPAGQAPAEGDGDVFIEDMPFEELNRLEFRADEARRAFWRGEYQNSIDIYDELTQLKHPSTPLFYNEMAMSYIALGDMKSAEQKLRDVDRMFQIYGSANIEKKAISKFGEEADKIYMGDPYERATNSLLLALIFMDRGDYDNALAACKTGLLADSDAHNNEYQSDFAMLHLLEGKLHQLRGQPDNAQKSYEVAREAHFNSHPLVRNSFSLRRQLIHFLGLTEKERKKRSIKETSAELSAQIERLDTSISALRSSVDADGELGPLLNGDYNTLIIYPSGKGPRKTRTGTDGAMVRFTTTDASFQAVSTQLNGAPVNAPTASIADIHYQATTRGGRRMDGILAGQAAFRNNTVVVGRTLTQLGQSVGGVIGLGVAILGASIQGAAGAISPEADTRAWGSLPASFGVYATRLPVGKHEVAFSQHVYFRRLSDHRTQVHIDDSNDMAVVFAPPQISGVFSQFVEDEGGKRKKRASSKTASLVSTFLLSPPLGFKKIERFPALAAGQKAKAFAVDDRKLERTTRKALAGVHVGVKTLSHREIVAGVEHLVTQYPVAFQMQLTDLGLRAAGKNNRDESFSATFEFALIDTSTGTVILGDTITGSYLKTRRDKTSNTKVFYQCFDGALATFLAGPEFLRIAAQAR